MRSTASGRIRLGFSLLVALGCATAAPPAPAPAPAPQAGLVVLGARADVTTYRFDPATGALRELGPRLPMGVRTAYLDVSRDGRFAYAGNGEPPGRIIALAIDATTGALSKVNEAPTAIGEDGGGISHVAVHPTGRWLLTAHLGSGRVSVLPIAGDGRIQPPTWSQILARGAHQMVTERSGRFVFCPVRDGQFVAQFKVDASAGQLAPNDPDRVASPPGSGPRHLAFSPDERFAYVNNESNGTVTSYGFDAANGRLTLIETLPTVPADFKETGTAHIAVDPAGRFVYVSNRFHGSIAAFARDATTGKLTLTEIETDNGNIKFPRDFFITRDSRFMLVANERGDSLSVLAIDPEDGRLSAVGPPVPAPTGPQVVVVR